ncbi:hypothetical protein NC651_033344 [Populus alba x Populus x berolinensis]|nr:hypothetical protein NC651_033344 [Populus alba x Populus x berolinensis]
MNVNLQNGNPFKYQVTKYFYLKSEDIAEVLELDLEGSAWIGYVAVTTDEGQIVLGRRDILVCWRGTILASEWSQDFQFDLTPASDIFGETNNPKVLAEVRRLVDMYALNGEEVSITVAGHSLGAALATLNGVDMVANGFNKPSAFLLGYQDVGEKLEIDSIKSPYLKDPKAEPHNLELYLHTIAGYQGQEEEFKLVVDRDIALLNKSLDLLQDKYNIPPKWWNVKNNGMIQIDNGFWKLNDYVPDPPTEDDVEGIILSLENSILSPA